jgi:hypothetical protein
MLAYLAESPPTYLAPMWVLTSASSVVFTEMVFLEDLVSMQALSCLDS